MFVCVLNMTRLETLFCILRWLSSYLVSRRPMASQYKFTSWHAQICTSPSLDWYTKTVSQHYTSPGRATTSQDSQPPFQTVIKRRIFEITRDYMTTVRLLNEVTLHDTAFPVTSYTSSYCGSVQRSRLTVRLSAHGSALRCA